MTVGALKKLLVLANVVAVLGLGGTAYGFWSHRDNMNRPHDWPDFAYTPARIAESVGQIKNTDMSLGLYPEKVEETAAKPEPEPEKEIIGVLERLGTITGAIAFPGPYGETGDQPAIIFDLKAGGTRTLARNEAIEMRPHPVYKDFRIPHRYQFIGCERDAENPDLIYFVFDMKCDGSDIQRVAWRQTSDTPDLETAKALPAGGEEIEVATDGATVVSESKLKRAIHEMEAAKKKAAEERAKAEEESRKAAEEKVKPLEVEDDQVLPTLDDGEVPDEFFEDEDGTWKTTDEGARYLEENWKKVVEETRASTYVNPTTGAREGILINRIPRGSAASKFGIYPDDVIKRVNGRPVTSKSQAINIVKDEIDNKKRRYIEVEILRNGRTIKKRYDTADPDTRRAARGLR